MNIFLLLLLGVAVIIIIIKVNSKKEPSPPSPHIVKKSIKLKDHYDLYETFDVVGVHTSDNKHYILTCCNEMDVVKIRKEPHNRFNPRALAIDHEGYKIGYIRDADLDEVEELIKGSYMAGLKSIDYEDDFLTVTLMIAYQEKPSSFGSYSSSPEEKHIILKSDDDKKPIKAKREGEYASNHDIGAEDFMIWKTNKIPHEYLTPKKDVENTSSYFYGKKVCISGQLSSFPYRGELAKYLWLAGADVDTSVGKTCEILISGDGTGPSKLKKAIEQGVQIMPETELSEKLNGFKSKYI